MQSDGEDEQALYHLILRMLDYEPTQRIQLADAVKHTFFAPLHRTSPATATEQSPSTKIDENSDVTQHQASTESPVTS